MNRNTTGLYQIKTSPAANPSAVIRGEHYRFTVLTSRMLRLEYDEEGVFEDRATQTVVCRDFPEAPFRVKDTEDKLEIITDFLHLIYDKKAFSKNGLSIKVKGNLTSYSSEWFYGVEAPNLKGTARTLDEADGAIPLGDGLLSRNGFSVIDDSAAMALREDGWMEPARKSRTDLYFFGYGRDYLACLKDFFRLCGPAPMLPRYALGNWWSRFHRYTDAEYMELVETFRKEEVPFSVAVLDMDWHLTEIDEKYGSGWTGYTWNRKLFPDPRAFLRSLHEKGMHVTLNVHPADGVRAHEEYYSEMAKAMHLETGNEDPIPFDASSPEFLENYFRFLHHPSEDMGVDFWWIDWQQNGGSRVEGIDPAWVLNHYHYLDNARGGKRPLILSRYAGAGSHRYPVGFSGDSFATWESLAFQPYFTATASNIGYGWWSHDIGGHMHGTRSDEMAVRWLQFGVFSPIMRIHGSDNPFNGKEPWNYNPIAEEVMKRFLRLRHQLIPYLYTMNCRFHEEGIPLLQPMYYQHPETEEAYQVPNEYYFGSELIVCPITVPMDPKLQLACFKAWLPDGVCYDIFTGRVYRGGRRIDLYRGMAAIPVLAKAGAILPLSGKDSVRNAADNPENLEILLFAGADGDFELYEDNDGEKEQGTLKAVRTPLSFRWGKTCRFTVGAVRGDGGVAPQARSYAVRVFGIREPAGIAVTAGGEPVAYGKSFSKERNCLELSFGPVDSKAEISVVLEGDGEVAVNDIAAQSFELLNRAQIPFDLKNDIYRILQKDSDLLKKTGELQAMDLDAELFGALYEVLAAW